MHIKEYSGMDLSKYIGSDDMVILTANRCNNLLIDNKVFINDVRVIHFFKNNTIELILGNKGTTERINQHITIRDVSEIIVKSVYW